MTEDNLGYMTKSTWETLTVEQQTWYLYDAVVNRCSTCGAFRGKIVKWLPALILVGSVIGGVLARVIGVEAVVHLIK